MRKIASVLAAVITLAAAACGGTRGVANGQGPGEAAPGPVQIHPEWTSCAADAPQQSSVSGDDTLNLPRLGSNFVPAAAVVCSQHPQPRADGGLDFVATEGKAEDIAALVTALRLPDQPRTRDACTLDLPVVTWFALLDAQGRWIQPGLPVDVCGKIRIEVREAVRTLALTPVTTKVLREMESAAAAAAGCSQGWADIAGAEASDKSRVWANTGVNPLAGATEVRLCAYEVPVSERGNGKPAGNFVHGGLLPPARWTPIEQALRAAGPARPCSTLGGGFALLRRSDGLHGEVYVELDGCHRIMLSPVTGGATLLQGDATLAALLGKPQ